MQNFEFHNPTKIIFGKGTLEKTGAAIHSYGSKKVFLIAGGGSIKKNGVYEQVMDSLKNADIAFVEAWAKTYKGETYDLNVHQDWQVAVNPDRQLIITHHRARLIE